MGIIGKNNFIVKQLHAKTKIKKEDIADILNLLPETMAEAFFEANPPEKTTVNLGPASASWRDTKWGPGIYFKPTETFRETIIKMKVQGKSALAASFFDKMPQRNKDMAKKKRLLPISNN